MRILAAFLFVTVTTARGQFEILDAHTTASLRGIDAVNERVAWASGSEGTVRLTIDGGATWKLCAVPKGAEKMDFRGVQGFDAKTALVMASGTGPLSAVFKTVDGCSTWKLALANPDAEGFFDAMRFTRGMDAIGKNGYVLGDPVAGRFALFQTIDRGEHWTRSNVADLKVAAPGIGGFAASNSSLLPESLSFATSGPAGPFFYRADLTCTMLTAERNPLSCVRDQMHMQVVRLPMEGSVASAGVFSMAELGLNVVAVGGDYAKPGVATGTAAYSTDAGTTWHAATKTPRGYRSSVQYAPNSKAWITVGPNGTDISFDDGQEWQPLTPAAGEASGVDKGWNAISLPFVVGSKGKVGRILTGVLTP